MTQFFLTNDLDAVLSDEARAARIKARKALADAQAAVTAAFDAYQASPVYDPALHKAWRDARVAYFQAKAHLESLNK